MLPLPRVGGARSGALETSIVGTGARVKPRVRVRPRLGRERCHLIHCCCATLSDRIGHFACDWAQAWPKSSVVCHCGYGSPRLRLVLRATLIVSADRWSGEAGK